MIPKKRQATACLFYVLGPSAVFCHLLTTIGTIFVPPFDVLSENVLFYLRIKVAQERCGNCKFVYWDRAHALSTRKKLWIARYSQAVQNPAGLQAICWRIPVSHRISTARGSGFLSAPGTDSISSMPVCPPIQRQPQFAGKYTGRNIHQAHRVEEEIRLRNWRRSE